MKAIAARLTAAVQDLSGDSIAIVLAAGFVLGTFPVYGCSTVLCLLAAVVFRLNAPALQLVNQVATPLQLALLLPFVRLGERILGAPAMASGGMGSRFNQLTMHAIAGWLCLSLPLGLLLYILLSHGLRRRAVRFLELENAA